MSYDLEKFTELLAQNLPGFQVKFKDESTLMKIIGVLLFFNKGFMTSFITTIGYTVYFPSRKGLADNGPRHAITTLAHEYRHAKDASKITRFLFGLLYLMPQLLAPLMLLFLLISWPLALGLFVLMLVPLPAPFRAYYELKGYTMSLFVSDQHLKAQGLSKQNRLLALTEQIEFYNKQFTGFNYYLMWPFGVKGKLTKAAERIVSGEILEDDDIYPEIAKALRESKQ